MKFQINHAPPPAPTGTLARVTQFLNALPDGEMLDIDHLAGKVNLTPFYLANTVRRLPPEFSLKQGHKKIYGSPKTIAAYRKQFLSA